MSEVIRTRFQEALSVIAQTQTRLSGRLAAAAEIIIQSYRSGGGVFIFGNGGSAADAQHIAGELVGRFLLNRRALKAVALTTDTSVLTCIANDFDYNSIFARQLEGNARSGDVAIGLSTSGNSANVVAALEYARGNGIKTIAFTGSGGGKCAALADVLLDVDCAHTPHTQEAHAVMYHILCELVEATMAGK
ncbi:MAG: SIS domain-containing protein [Phycisphaerae bacterium]|jgi:D-sedoheptulose 7-phosphate isomerase